MSSSPQALNPATLPLQGLRLIEASAGTGKTYTISGLYLRLLLGDAQKKPLTCEQILVVTFTNAATEELRDRIRARIKNCYQHFIGLPTDDVFIQQLFQQVAEEDRHQAICRLDLALKTLDEAAIFTIHGFCQRILADMAFESGLLFDAQFILDDNEYLIQTTQDYWRQNCYPLSETLASLIRKKATDPEALIHTLKSVLGTTQVTPSKQPKDFQLLNDALTEKVQALKDNWQQQIEPLFEYLKQQPLNKTSYGAREEAYPKLQLAIQEIEQWIEIDTGLPPAKTLEKLGEVNLTKRTNKGGVPPTADDFPIIGIIDELPAIIEEFQQSFLYCARQQIQADFRQLKAEENILSPDDLLLSLAQALGYRLDTNLEQDQQDQHALETAALLSAQIAKRYPVALIDEFQDTDPLQYAIFAAIYHQAPLSESEIEHESENATENTTLTEQHGQTLLMIGDPKQAIYAFRGADIYTYLQAKNDTEEHYHLETNYRSSHAMVHAVNSLFNQHQTPFKEEHIKFDSVLAKDSGEKQILNPTTAPWALDIRLLQEEKDKSLTKAVATKVLAEDCAQTITELLNDAAQGRANFQSHPNRPAQPIEAKDIAILVRSKHQARAMQKALQAKKIGAVFLSRDSVLATPIAADLLFILKAIANPRDEAFIRTALAGSLINENTTQLHRFNTSEQLRAQVLQQFAELHQLWLKRGVMPALLRFASEFQLLARNQALEDGDRRLTDFRHLAELLQTQASQLEGMTALINWFEQQIVQQSNQEEQQLRLESEQNLVQIVTIHKSKGLEYPICFLPFISLASTKKNELAVYHDQQQLIWDVKGGQQATDAAAAEALAEELRLLYVALTRPVFRCYLSIANQGRITKDKDKSKFSSELPLTAIAYLLGIEEKYSFGEQIEEKIKQWLAQLPSEAQRYIRYSKIERNTNKQVYQPPAVMQTVPLQAQEAAPRTRTPWRVGSYSGLVLNAGHSNLQVGATDEGQEESILFQVEPIEQQSTDYNRFQFDRGANPGSFMHLVLERIDFTRAAKDLPEQLPLAMKQYAISEHWLPTLEAWYLDLLQAKLDQHLPQDEAEKGQQIAQQGFSLSQLTASQKFVEMEFYIPLGNAEQQSLLQDHKLKKLLAQHHYPIDLKFDQFTGLLKGFIDLVFEYQGQYFIADYKSNHLGDNFQAYQQNMMAQTIHQHQYHLQYLIYSLALHRFLKLRLADYDYQTHFGGCYYLFLRGMSAELTTGIYYDKPNVALIEALDQLFLGNEHAH